MCGFSVCRALELSNQWSVVQRIGTQDYMDSVSGVGFQQFGEPCRGVVM